MNILQMYRDWRENKQLSQEYEENWLPAWAIGRTDGQYTDMHAQLSTKNGMKIGNAVSLGLEENQGISFIKIVTDSGNLLLLTQSEVEDLFYPPQFIMGSLLPAHKQALMDEKNNPDFKGIPDFKIGVSADNGVSYTFCFHTHEEREAFGYGIKIATQMSGGSSQDEVHDTEEFTANAMDYKKQMN